MDQGTLTVPFFIGIIVRFLRSVWKILLEHMMMSSLVRGVTI